MKIHNNETVKATKSHLGNVVDIDKCSDGNVLTKGRQGNITERKSNVGGALWEL